MHTIRIAAVIVVLFSCVLFAASTVFAVPVEIYSTFGSGDGYAVRPGWVVGNVGPAGPIVWETAASFIPDADYALGSVNLALLTHFGVSPFTWTVSIFAGAAEPSALIEAQSLVAASSVPALYSVDFSSSTVLAGNTYWIVLASSDASVEASIAWLATSDPDLQGGFSSRSEYYTNNEWRARDAQHSLAFALWGEALPTKAPEPSTMLLLGSGLFGLLAGRRIFKR